MSDSDPAVEDAELVEKLRRGEAAAVMELYNTYFDRIYSLVFHQVAPDLDAAQDIVQETFLAALKSAGKFHGRSKVYTWLYSIANKKVADFYRRRKREAKHQTEPSHSRIAELEQTSGGEPSVSEAMESEETRQAIQETLSSLPLHYKQVLLLKYVEEMPVLEISQVMGRSPKSIEGLLTRVRKELRDKLTTQNEGLRQVKATSIIEDTR